MKDLLTFRGQSVVVTGASRGIGLSIASAFLDRGADVISIQRGELSPALVAHAERAGASVRATRADLNEPEQITDAIDGILSSARVDVVVNNAGMQHWHDSTEFPLEVFERILDVNLRAVFQICQGFGRSMLERGRGKIINMASMTSFIGGYRAPAYAASKGAVAQLTKALCNEWAQHGVNVNAIAPGYLATEMNRPLIEDSVRSAEIMTRIPAKRWGEPEAIANAALFLASDAADYIHGVVLPVDGGWLAR